jgi:hypothetical protein
MVVLLVAVKTMPGEVGLWSCGGGWIAGRQSCGLFVGSIGSSWRVMAVARPLSDMVVLVVVVWWASRFKVLDICLSAEAERGAVVDLATRCWRLTSIDHAARMEYGQQQPLE